MMKCMYYCMLAYDELGAYAAYVPFIIHPLLCTFDKHVLDFYRKVLACANECNLRLCILASAAMFIFP